SRRRARGHRRHPPREGVPAPQTAPAAGGQAPKRPEKRAFRACHPIVTIDAINPDFHGATRESRKKSIRCRNLNSQSAADLWREFACVLRDPSPYFCKVVVSC